MRFLIFPEHCVPFHGKTLDEEPIGGTETAVIRLAEALDAKGHEVFVITAMPNAPQTKPRYIQLHDVLKIGPVDVFVVTRELKGMNLPIKAKKKFFWTGDAWDNMNTYGIGDRRYVEQIDGLFAVGEWQAETLCESSGFPREKTFILRNGVNLELFQQAETRIPKRLIYSSQPHRGLTHLLPIFLELKKKHADLELHIFCSTLNFRPRSFVDKQVDLKSPVWAFKNVEGCFPHGTIPQQQLALEMLKSSLWVYPTAFEETSCISAMEAQAAGCAIVTSRLAALPETIGEAGILLEPLAGTALYQEQFVEACDRILCDPALFEKLSTSGKNRAKGFEWSARAQELLDYLRDRHGLS